MSALAMILAAGMAVGDGTGPEKVSSGVTRTGPSQLEWGWEGVWKWDDSGRSERSWIRNGYLWMRHPNKIFKFPFAHRLASIKDKGDGKFSLEGIRFLGIYRQHGNNLTLFYREQAMPFLSGDGQYLFILRRIKPRK